VTTLTSNPTLFKTRPPLPQRRGYQAAQRPSTLLRAL
jgi:hypothetical protein